MAQWWSDYLETLREGARIVVLENYAKHVA